MKFSRIILNNFRQYKGENIIDLNSSKSKPINIIVGENGSGKSNFFRAINWCLYGENNGKNLSQINHSLLNEVKKGSKLEMSVTIELIDESGNNLILTKKEISIKATDMRGNSKATAKIDDIKYKVEYWDDGHQFKATEFEYRNFVNRTLPFELSKFFFIDGDDLLNTIKKLKQNDIKKHFYSLTKISDAQQVYNNLKNWKSKIKQNNLSRKKSDDVEVYKKLRNEAYKNWQDKVGEIEELEKDIKEFEEKLSTLEPQINAFKQGKTLRDKVNDLNSIIALKQKNLDKIIEKRRIEIIDSMPIILLNEATKKFDELVKKARNDDSLPKPYIKNIDILKQILDKDDNLIVNDKKFGSVSWNNKNNQSTFFKELKKYNKAIKKRVDSDFSDRAMGGEAIINSFFKLNKEDVINSSNDSFKEGEKLEKEITTLTKERNEINEQLKGSLPAEEKRIQDRYDRLNEDYHRRLQSKISAEAVRDESKKSYDKQQRNLSNMENYAKIGDSNQKKIDDINDAMEILNTSIELLSATAVNDINEILNMVLARSDIKDDFKSANIYQDFSIEVLNTANNNLLDEDEGGSNGQKLIIAYSYMYAMKLGTGINFPILIDSPYGKLGTEFRKQVSNNFITNINDNLQVSFLFHGEEYSDIVRSTFKNKVSNKVCIRVSEKDKLDIVSSYISKPEDFDSDLELIKGNAK